MKVLTEVGLSQLITNIKTGYAAKSHNQASSTINALTGYEKPSETSALTTTDTLNAALGKLEKALDGKQASGNYLTSVAWGDVTGKPSSFTPASHNQASSTINAMTVYAKASSAAAISTSDSLNTAIGKLEKALDGKAASGHNHSGTYAPVSHEHTTADVTALTGYAIASSAAAIAATDSLNTALGKLQKSIDGKLGSGAQAEDAKKLGGTAASSYAKLASPAFTGTPTAPTASAGTNTTQVATTAFVQTAVAGLVNSAPEALDTLAELSAALGDDPNFATTIATQIGGKADASHTHVGTEVTLTGYAKASSASAVAATDTVNAAIGKLEKALDGKQASGSYASSGHNHDSVYVPLTRKVNGKALSADITLSGADIAVTGYSKASSVAAIAATDTINVALGKLEKALDGKQASGSYASSSHTHNYAGSSSAGGAATSANKLNTDAGSATQPVYFADGVPVATTYTLEKSVPSNAVFTDTNTKVNVTLGTTTKAYLLGTSTTPTSSAQGVTAIGDTGVYLSTTAGELVATKFTGALNGNANTASKIYTSAKIGDTNKPVYIAADGTVTAISYTISKSVPSNAVFTDTKLGSDHILTGYSKASSAAAVAATDSVNAAIGKLEYKIDAITEYTAEEVAAVWDAA